MTITICAMGELLAELLSRNPHRKFTQPGEFIGLFPSGAPAIFAARVVELPHRAVSFGCVSNDDFGRSITECLHHEGVITDGAHVMNNIITGTAFVSYQNPRQRGFVFNIPDSAYGLFTAEHIDKGLPRQCNHLYVVGSSSFSFRMIDVIRKTITTVRSTDGTVSFDPNIHKEMLSIPEMAQALDCSVEYTDTSIPGESELPFSACHRNLSEEQIVSNLLHGGIEHMTIKHAWRGVSYYKLKGGTLRVQHVAGHDIEVIDPTGAGDYFGATFITLFLSGFPAHKAL